MKTFSFLPLLALQIPLTAAAQAGKLATTLPANQVRLATGLLEGTTAASGVREFKGMPFAAPPVGKLRWQPPQPVPKWAGVRAAKAFGPRAMQLPLYGD